MEDIHCTDGIYSLHDSSFTRAAVRGMLASGSDPLGYPCATNLPSLEEFIGDGLHAGYLYTVDGPAGMGKTAFLLSVLHTLSIVAGHPVIYFSLQHSIDELIRRILVILEGRDILQCFENGYEPTENDRRKLREGVSFIEDSSIYLADGASCISMRDFISNIYRLRDEIHPELIMIDGLDRYVQDRNEDNSAALLTEHIRNIGIPLIATCGVKKTVECRRDYKPEPDDFLWYDLVHESDVVFDLFRPSYYKKNANGDIADIRIIKNSFGQTGVAHIHYDGKRMFWQE